MLTRTATVLLNNMPSGFPLLEAAKSSSDGCSSCRHRRVNVEDMVRFAVAKYKTDPRFIEHCRKLFGLPAVIQGVTIEEIVK